MTNLVHSVVSSQSTLPSDNTMVATVSATIYTDGVPAIAGVTVNWAVSSGGTIDQVTSTTDATGVATTGLKATSPAQIKVTATTGDDAKGKSAMVTASKPLTTPTVLNASEGDAYTLDQYDLKFGVTATIPFYTGAAAGQTITFNWDVVDQKQIMVTSDTTFPISVDVSNDMKPACLNDGNYEVYYDVVDAAGNDSYSASVILTVYQGGQSTPTLPAPTIPDVSEDPYINIQDANSGVEVDINYNGMTIGDLVTLYWSAFDKASNLITNACTTLPYTVTQDDISAGVVLVLDPSLFYPGQNNEGYEGSFDAYYTVNRAGLPAAILSYSTDALVDTIQP